MLEKLFGSNSRVKILKIFLLNANQKFYIRQLARDLKLQLNSVRRELENLEKFGLLISSVGSEGEKTKQEKKFYQVNPDFVLFEEIKALIMKAQILYEKDFIEKLKNIGKLKLLVLTGIFVNNPNSPIDLLIVGKFNKLKFLKLIREIEKEMGREINYTLFDRQELKYRHDITDVFLYNVLEGRKIVVIDEIGLI
jgi:DNA-binding transcriptional regulator YhcF (GntR family)